MSVGLYLIVKDEAGSLPRLLDSVRGGFDHIALTDTGSTDATVVVFEDWCVEHHQPYSVHQFGWVNDFGAARQYALERLEASGVDWCVWCDADDTADGIENLAEMIAVVEDRSPESGCILMPYAWTPTFVGYHIRATRRGCSRWEGRRHESQIVEGGRAKISQVAWKTNRDGGERRSFEDDLKALREDIAEDPTNARSQFYLAQTYKDMGRTAEAVVEYDKRVNMGGWGEEVYTAAYVGACLSADLNPDGDWIQRALAAHELRPTRAEPLHELARRLRMRGLFHTALMFADRAMALPIPEDILFVHRWVYEWGAAFEASICEYYCGQPYRCIRMSQDILRDWDVPENVAEALHKNIQFAEALMALPE